MIRYQFLKSALTYLYFQMDSLAVLSNMVMPALFPMCMVMTKLGYVLMGTSEKNAILEVLPDGILVCSR